MVIGVPSSSQARQVAALDEVEIDLLAVNPNARGRN
jgi:hypothetical protein